MTKLNSELTESRQAPLNLELPALSRLEEAAELARKTAAERGASDCAVAASAHTGISIALRECEVESLEFQRDRDLGITVYFGQRKGHAATADFRPEAIREAVTAACSIARYTQEDEAAGLPDVERLATNFPDLQQDHPTTQSLDALLDIGRNCEARGLAATAINASDGMHLSASRQLSLLQNSLGFSGARISSDYGLSLSLIGNDDSGKRRDYWFAHDLNDGVFSEADSVADTAIARVQRGLNPRQPKTGTCPVIFPPELARSLIGSLLGAISGRAIYQRSSFLLDSHGQRIFPNSVNILQRPHEPGRIGSASFDSEGVATQDRSLIEDGVLQGWLLGTYSARRLGLQTTGNAGGAQRIEVPATSSLDAAAMMKEAGSGLLLTSLMGQGTKITTGDYSRGATGIWFENGEPAYPVHECTIAGNLADMFQKIRAIGTDADHRSGIEIGSIWLDSMMVAGS